MTIQYIYTGGRKSPPLKKVEPNIELTLEKVEQNYLIYFLEK
jgi:hypothetical protein